MEAYLASIISFAGSFAPVGWMYCDGQILSISQYTALFSLLGTTYGGDGQRTFALPKLPSLQSGGGGEISYIMCVEGIYPQRP